MESTNPLTTQRAEKLLHALFGVAGEGHHVMTASAGTFAAIVPFDTRANRTYLEEGRQLADVVAETALALSGGEVCGVVLRTHAHGSSRVWGWRLGAAIAAPLTAGQLRRAYSYDCETGEALPLERGLRYEGAPCLRLSAPPTST
ncbi:hypothetical protein ACFV0Q_41905, partial [Streptomyces sp. NPDC059564]